jgi:hypothetical protein
MDTEETATIVRLVKSIFPQQPIDKTTYETWHLVIGHLDYTVAQAAVIAIAHSERFCAAADIIREADRAQRRHAHPSERTVAEAVAASSLRELDAGPFPPPSEDYRRAKQEMLATLALRDARAMRERPPHPPVSAAERHAAYRVKCPWCSAQPGSRCVNTVAGTPKDEPHPARLAEARLEAAGAAGT